MTSARTRRPVLSLTLTLSVLLSCGAEHGDDTNDEGAKSSDAGPGGSLLGDAFTGFVGEIEQPLPMGLDPDQAACASRSVAAERLPLDLLVMMDSSGSMLDEVAPNRSKWAAVSEALSAFFADPASQGIGVGLHFFPQLQAGVPAECSLDSQCGDFGPCTRLRTCTQVDEVTFCGADADCGARGPCQPLGQCSLTGDFCIPVGAPCGGGPRGTPRGNTCLEIPGYCDARDRCDVPAYSTPAVDVGVLPGASMALAGALQGRRPDGLTPTAPALSGIIDRARQRAIANPSRKVAVVLATDGFPTTCAPLAVDEIAAIAREGANASPVIPTFVIGVFAPDEAADATTNLNTLAQAGGSRSAFIVQTNQDVTATFLQALGEIRGAALPCSYRVPKPSQGVADYFRVNVLFTAPNAAPATIPWVENASACDGSAEGWYYDMDPRTGNTPTTITVCPTTCNRIATHDDGQVDILLGCGTVVAD